LELQNSKNRLWLGFFAINLYLLHLSDFHGLVLE
jgi:hypothetical protein